MEREVLEPNKQRSCGYEFSLLAVAVLCEAQHKASFEVSQKTLVLRCGLLNRDVVFMLVWSGVFPNTVVLPRTMVHPLCWRVMRSAPRWRWSHEQQKRPTRESDESQTRAEFEKGWKHCFVAD